MVLKLKLKPLSITKVNVDFWVFLSVLVVKKNPDFESL